MNTTDSTIQVNRLFDGQIYVLGCLTFLSSNELVNIAFVARMDGKHSSESKHLGPAHVCIRCDMYATYATYVRFGIT